MRTTTSRAAICDAARDGESMTVEASLASDTPVQRAGYREILDCTPGAVDLSRARDGLPLLMHHDTGQLVGRVHGIRADGKRLRGRLNFFETAAGKEAAAMIAGGHRELSVSYTVDATRPMANGDVLVTRWTLLEVSIVSIPADASIGASRSMNMNFRSASAFDWAEHLGALIDLQGDMTSRIDPSVYEATRASERGMGGYGAGRAIVVPLDVLARRDLAAGSGSAGGYLIGAPVTPAERSMRPYSEVLRAGARLVDLPIGNVPGVPFVTVGGEFVAGWAASEGADVPESNLAIGLRQVATKTMGFSFKVSRRLITMGGPQASALIEAEAMAAMGRGLDVAALQGSGAGGQPLGLVNKPGVFAQSGAALAWSGILAMREAVANGGAVDETQRFIGGPDVRRLLSARERAAGSGFIWDDGRVDGLPALAPRECPASTLICGDFGQLSIVVHGGITVIVDPRFNQSGTHRIVLLADVDVVVPRPEVFAVASTVS